MKLMINKAKSYDQLFEQTGVEEDQFNLSIRKLALQKDPEVMLMI